MWLLRKYRYNNKCVGSYCSRFNWTDGKLNSSNLIELSGQISEKFDEEFRILYAQSLPLNTRGPAGVSSIFENLMVKHSVTFSPRMVKETPVEAACVTSTPSRRPQTLVFEPPCEPTSPDHRRASPASDSSTIDGTEQKHMQEEILAGSVTRHFPVEQQPVSCHASTQTSQSVADSDTQTDIQLVQPPGFIMAPSAGPLHATLPPPTSQQTLHPRVAPDASLKDTFRKLTKERQYHYSAIRSKLEHMMTSLNERRELADVTNVTRGVSAPSRQRVHKDCVLEPNPRAPVEGAGMGTWPRARCLH